MAIGRKKALERMTKLAEQIELHLGKLANDPRNAAANHWRHESTNWIAQVEALNRHVGAKTASEWSHRIQSWKARLGS